VRHARGVADDFDSAVDGGVDFLVAGGCVFRQPGIAGGGEAGLVGAGGGAGFGDRAVAPEGGENGGIIERQGEFPQRVSGFLFCG
jgi:hypothetical protein